MNLRYIPVIVAALAHLAVAQAATSHVVTTPNAAGSMVSGNISKADSATDITDSGIPAAGVPFTAATVSAFRLSNFTNAQWVYLRGAVTTGDSGPGLFRSMATTSCTDDGGAVLKDMNSNCFLRDRVSASPVSLKWYGYTAGSDQATFCGGGDCLVKAFAAATAYGNNKVTTDGLVVTSSSSVVGADHIDFSCGNSYEGVETSADFSAVPGSIIFTHGHGLYPSGNNERFHDCMILTNGSGGTTINLHPTTQRNALDNDAAMIANADTGVACEGQTGGESIEFDHLVIIGFDTGLQEYMCARAEIHYVKIDANVGYFQGPMKAPAFVDHVRIFPFLANGVTGKNIPYPVTAIASGSGGVCRVTVSSTSAFATGDYFNLVPDRTIGDANMGPLSCYGVWQVTVIDGTHLDLQSSVYATGSWYTTSAASNWLANTYVLHVPAPSTAGGQGIMAGETVSGALSGTVKYVSNYVPPIATGGTGYMDVVIDTKTGSSGSGALTFSNLGAYVNGANACGVGNTTSTDSACGYLYSTWHYGAGNSYGGRSAGNIATAFLAGGPGDTSTGGFMGSQLYAFGHRRYYNMLAAGPAKCSECDFDGQSELWDPNQIGLIYGSGNPWLTDTGTTTNGTKAITITGLDPRKAGWHVGDFITGTGIPNDGSSCSGSALTAVSASSVTITNNATASGTVTLTDQGSSNASCGVYTNYTASGYFSGTSLGGGGYLVSDSGNAGPNMISGAFIQQNNPGLPLIDITRGKAVIVGLTTTYNNAAIVDQAAAQVSMLGSGSVTAAPGPIYLDGLSAAQNFVGAGNFFQGGGASNVTAFGDTSACVTADKTSEPAPLTVCSGSAVFGQANGGACGDGCTNAMFYKSNPYTVATLPTCNSGSKGTHAFATDIVASAFSGAVVGGGSNARPVFCDGSSWLIGMLDDWYLRWPANDNAILEERRYG